jgi:hypothetical protein
MGMPQDRQQRETLERNDDRRRVMVSTARSLIYEQDYGVGSTAVEALLKPQSWVPTSVRLELPLLTMTNQPIERIFRSPCCFRF